MTARILTGDCRTMLATLPDRSARCCVTSPPYYGLRDYGHDGQIGLEQTPDAYVAELVAVFREVRRVLADDGTLWLNLGDSYTGNAASGGTNANDGGPAVRVTGTPSKRGAGLKPKDLIGIPWQVAFALRADGWYLRSEIIWHKPAPMPESVTDRPTKAHEQVFLLSKQERYFYDAAAIAEPISVQTKPQLRPAHTPHGAESRLRNDEGRLGGGSVGGTDGTRNARTVWTIGPEPFAGAHFATMPPELARRCILAGSAKGDTVLDPFTGAGTTGLVADRNGRHFVGTELNPTYADMARERIRGAAPLFAEVTK